MLVGAIEWVIIQLKFPWGCKTTCVLFVLISFTTRYCKLINAGFLIHKVTWIPMCPNKKTLRMIRAEPNPAEPRPAPDLMEKTWDSLRIVELGWRAGTGLWFGPGWLWSPLPRIHPCFSSLLHIQEDIPRVCNHPFCGSRLVVLILGFRSPNNTIPLAPKQVFCSLIPQHSSLQVSLAILIWLLFLGVYPTEQWD